MNWQEAVMAYFEVLCQNWLAIEENQKILSEVAVCQAENLKSLTNKR
jgi:hypothetical protein